jgi:hypothetical protein
VADDHAITLADDDPAVRLLDDRAPSFDAFLPLRAKFFKPTAILTNILTRRCDAWRDCRRLPDALLRLRRLRG